MDFLYPREGTETSKSRPCRMASVIFFIPARGRKHPPESALIVRIGFSLSPRGDGNRRSEIVDLIAPDFLYPREGTETRCSLSQAPHAMIFFIPARGRKHIFAARRVYRVRFYLSPRGDGNVHSSIRTHASNDFLYPREGTETNIMMPLSKKSVDFLYPREGTETHTGAPSISCNRDFLHPRKGPPFPTKIDIFAIHLFTNSA